MGGCSLLLLLLRGCLLLLLLRRFANPMYVCIMGFARPIARPPRICRHSACIMDLENLKQPDESYVIDGILFDGALFLTASHARHKKKAGRLGAPPFANPMYVFIMSI